MPDSELLVQFARDRSEEAFATLVRRHVDLVYSAALRQVRSPQLAEDVSQTVFLDLSRNAEKLKPQTILTAWLYSVTRRAAIDVVRSESRRQLREQIAVELADMNSPDTHWKNIEPLLDEAMETLAADDRSSLLLRYFENKSLREVGETLGTSDDAAQKRVSRAVEQLREYFSKKGIAIGSGAVVALLSANAVQSAPLALAAAISSGIGLATTGTIAAGKILIMTTAQKILITTTIAVALGTGIYGLQQSSHLQNELLQSQQKQKPLADENAKLRAERDKAKADLASLQEENDRLQKATAELPKLRGNAALLQENSRQLAQLKAGAKTNNNLGDMVSKMMDSPAWKTQMRNMALKSMKEQYSSLFKKLNVTPEEQEKWCGLMADKQMSNMENGLAILKGGDKAAIQKEIMANNEKSDEEVKALLGDERYDQFKLLEKRLPDEMNVSAFKKQLGENPLAGEQEKQLLDVMVDVRANTPNFSHPEADSFGKFNPAIAQKYLDAQEQMDQQVRTRAAAFLNPEQLKVLEDYQAQSVSMRQMGLKMQQSMLDDKGK
jgi:RNA polymerase sigma factor (sigma-70 family)